MARPENPGPSPAYLALVLLLLLPAATATSYTSLCRSPAPADDLTAGEHSLSNPPRLPSLSTGYFSGGAKLLFASDPYLPRSFSFFPRRAARTTDAALLHLFATVTLSGSRAFGRRDVRSHSVSFDLEGYYSTASAELCMVGSGSRARDDGLGVVILPDVALRVSLPHPANLSQPFVTGRLEGAGFGTITVVTYADDEYSYSQSASCPRPPAALRGTHRLLNSDVSCPRLKALLRSSYSLEYSASFPLPLRYQRMYVNQMHCAENGAVRAYMVLYTNQSDTLSSNHTLLWRHGFLVGDEALVAEGFWDSSRGLLCLKACRVVGSEPSSADLAVRECGIGMSFWFPAVWSIRDRSVVAGLIWNTSRTSDDGLEKMSGVISVSRIGNYMDNLSNITYSYTRVEEAKKYYYSKAELSKERKGVFPGNYSYRDFAFNFYLKGQGGYGYASPVTIGSALVDGDRLMGDDAFSRHAVAEMNKQRLLNVSYDMHHYQYQLVAYANSSANVSRTKSEGWRISAEGVYDTKTGSLCMVACQVNSNSSDYNSSDCEVLVTVQFASIEAEAGERTTVGAISSLRKRTDPLFFETLNILADGMYVIQVAESISRMDMESIMLVLSMTLSCVFIVLQLRHAKKNPEALPATSITMLVVMAVGYVIPLVLNFEATFTNSRGPFVQLTSGGWLELNEVMLRASTMVAFVLQLRLLQLAWSGRSTTEAGKHDSSAAERSTLWICLPLYLLGGVLIWIIHISDGHAQMNQARGVALHAPRRALSDDLASYAGLILDGFLLPQVILNALTGSRVKAISPWFYVGGTVIRAMPHAYDVFRAHNYVPSWGLSYVYASPRDDLFSVAWDVVIPLGAALLAVLLFLQQRLGGAFLCCSESRRSGEYEVVVSSTLSS